MTGPRDPYPSSQDPYPQNPYNQNPYNQNQPNYGQPDPYNAPPQYGGYQQQPPPSPKNGLGIAALILGILSIIAFWSFGFGIIMGIAAVILGFMGRSRVKKGTATNGGMSITAIVLGIIGILAGAAFLAATVWFVNETGVVDYGTCVSNAGSDSAAAAQCQEEFQNNIENRFDVTVTPFPTP